MLFVVPSGTAAAAVAAAAILIASVGFDKGLARVIPSPSLGGENPGKYLINWLIQLEALSVSGRLFLYNSSLPVGHDSDVKLNKVQK